MLEIRKQGIRVIGVQADGAVLFAGKVVPDAAMKPETGELQIKLGDYGVRTVLDGEHRDVYIVGPDSSDIYPNEDPFVPLPGNLVIASKSGSETTPNVILTDFTDMKTRGPVVEHAVRPPVPVPGIDQVEATQLRLHWTDAWPGKGDVSFEIERTEGTNVVHMGTARPETAVIDRDLTPRTTYSYRVLATNDHGQSDYSDPVGQTTSAAPPLATPENLYAKVVSKTSRGFQVELTWEYSGPNPTMFEIERTTLGGEWGEKPIAIVDDPQRSFQDQAEGKYRYRLWARDKHSSSKTTAAVRAYEAFEWWKPRLRSSWPPYLLKPGQTSKPFTGRQVPLLYDIVTDHKNRKDDIEVKKYASGTKTQDGSTRGRVEVRVVRNGEVWIKVYFSTEFL